ISFDCHCGIWQEEKGDRMPQTKLEALRAKAKLLQKAKKRAGKTIQLKTAFEIIAKTAGYASWRDLKKEVEEKEWLSFPLKGGYWNTWYNSYEEAREHFEKTGGFLLPFEKHFFVCEDSYMENLGIAHDDPDLLAVGKN